MLLLHRWRRIEFFAKVEHLHEQIIWSYKHVCRTHASCASSRYRTFEYDGYNDHCTSCSVSHDTIPGSSEESRSHRGMADRSLWPLPVDCRARLRCAFRSFWATPHPLHLSAWFRVWLSHPGSWWYALAALPRTHHRWLDRREH